MASEDDLEALRAERDALRYAHALAISVAEDYRREWQESNQVNERLTLDLRHARLWANYYDATITAMERHFEQGQPYVVPDGPGMTEIASDGWGAGDALP